MEKLISGRCTGKTTTLVQMSVANQVPIIVANKKIKDNMIHKAMKNGYKLPTPITASEVISQDFGRGNHIKAVYIDDIEYVMAEMLKQKGLAIDIVSMCDNDNGQ